ncbi:MAG: ABC transporter permease, partial [Planctomycetes bacterium]|nr:ABC transporter permease [Planctomycetota bacterium]
RTASGRRLRAIGGGATAARLAGVNRGWALFLAFALSAVGAGFFGVNLRLLGTHSPFDFWGSWFLG